MSLKYIFDSTTSEIQKSKIVQNTILQSHKSSISSEIKSSAKWLVSFADDAKPTETFIKK
jgi:hypothetical protein